MLLRRARPLKSIQASFFDRLEGLRRVVLAEIAKAGSNQAAMAAVGVAFDRECLLLGAEESFSQSRAREAVLGTSPGNYIDLARTSSSGAGFQRARCSPREDKGRPQRRGAANPSRPMSLWGPFAREAPGRYAALGAREPKASLPLPVIKGDGVVGSMSAHWMAWRQLGAPRKVVQWLRSGVPLVWARPPQPTLLTSKAKQTEEMKQEMKDLINTGAFSYQGTRFISPTFIIPKKDGGKRMIHDLRGINSSLKPPKFTLQGARDAASVVLDSNWLLALDLKHGYQQVAMDL